MNKIIGGSCYGAGALTGPDGRSRAVRASAILALVVAFTASRAGIRLRGQTVVALVRGMIQTVVV